jgi:glycosyltransferase involved in cell wall biosynthesis
MVNVGIIIPSYNDKETVVELAKAAQQYASHVLVVDDGSTDNTFGFCTDAGINVIRHEKNQGKSAAIVTGLRVLSSCKLDIVVFMDADGQHFASDLPKLIKPIELGLCDAVKGYRDLSKRTLVSVVIGLLVDMMFQSKDSLCGFFAIKSEALSKIQLNHSKRFLLEIVLLQQLKKFDLKLCYMLIDTKGSNRIGLITAVKSFMYYLFR